jgi:hypothetical protein
MTKLLFMDGRKYKVIHMELSRVLKTKYFGPLFPAIGLWPNMVPTDLPTGPAKTFHFSVLASGRGDVISFRTRDLNTYSLFNQDTGLYFVWGRQFRL